MSAYLDYPFHLDGRGRSAVTDEDDHILDLIHQVLFTVPGERVNRPDFGCGLKQLVFMPKSDALAVATQTMVHGALNRQLGRLIQVESVTVEGVDSELLITVVYIKRTSGERVTGRFNQSGTWETSSC
jgi:phage baseplate assembly protein W